VAVSVIGEDERGQVGERRGEREHQDGIGFSPPAHDFDDAHRDPHGERRGRERAGERERRPQGTRAAIEGREAACRIVEQQGADARAVDDIARAIRRKP
jgi:hypothetical protein